MSPVGPMFNAAVDSTEKSSKNPKIQSLVDEIINDYSESRQKASINPESSKNEVPTPRIFPKTLLPMMENNENPVEINATYVPNLRVEGFTGNSQSRTKDDIIDYSDGESDDDDDEDDEQNPGEETEGENEEDDSIDDIKPKGEDMEMKKEGFTLPGTIEGVRDRFNQLYVEFMRHNNHKHTNELMFLLDEMLRQGAITPTEYTQLNTGLTEAANLKTDEAEKEEDSDDDKEQNLTKSAVDYIIQRDKEDLLQLIEELKDHIDEDFMDIVLDIEKLLEIFFRRGVFGWRIYQSTN